MKKINHSINRSNFIFWGRISSEKGLDRALIIFSKVAYFHKDARFIIIGPDGGELSNIKNICANLGITDHVEFYDELNVKKIESFAKKSTFYIQTSIHDEMALSVLEAIQLGLIPVVTPVGDITDYCNEDNSVIVYSNYEAVREILIILDGHHEFKQKSIDTFLALKNDVSYKNLFFVDYDIEKGQFH
ncbi:glycosyltransferase [Candidatus Thioglobus sp.]|nr:glycosyltransferase [Candidatus Thioglobus sp.]